MKPLLFLKELKQKGFVEMPSSVSAEEIKIASENFIKFLSLPQNIKDKLGFQLDPEDRGSNVGYKRKRQESGDLDEKEYFHYHSAAKTGLASFFEKEGFEHKDFFLSAQSIYEKALQMSKEIIKDLDRTKPGLYNKFFDNNSDPRFYLRFVAYHKKDSQNFLAAGHYDRGTFTLAIGESAPGLRIGKNETDISLVNRKLGTILFMPEFRFPEVVGNEFSPAWHDVIQKSENSYSDTIVRWAIVFFADILEQNTTDFTKAHSPKS